MNRNVIVLSDPTRTIVNLSECGAIRSCQEYIEEEKENGDVNIEEGDASIRFTFPNRCGELVVIYESEELRDADYEKIISRFTPSQ